MSYDTEHVRNVGNGPTMITGLSTFTELLTNTNLADLYIAIRLSPGVTAPEIADQVAVSKKTVYEYLHRLERAGLITETKDDSATRAYNAEDFELTLTIRGIEITITPKLVAVIAQSDAYPIINRICDEHGFVTFALAHDLINAHSDGEVTIRQIAALTDLSHGTTYDLLEALYEIHDIGGDGPSPTTYSPADVAEDDLFSELTDNK
ncbi:MarR family transcriptional regulator [Halorubraceae archaeon YAN]|nr:MarR family transcriptional regulator [Halorubraceae archaeon YAN]